jgi:copper transport protein
VVGLAEVAAYAVRASGEPFSLGLLAQGLLQTRVGRLWLARLGLGLVLALVARLPSAEGVPWPWAISVVLGEALLIPVSLSSHAAAAGDLLPLLTDWAHLAAAAAWTGGLLGFVLGLVGLPEERRRELIPKAVARFSKVATFAVLLLGSTGLYATLLHVDEWAELVSTDWGRALLVKLALLVPLLLLGAVNLVKQGRGPFRKLVTGELVLAGALFVAAGFLSSAPPANVAAALQQGPFDQVHTVDGLKIEFRIEPFEFGYNDGLVMLSTADGQPVSGANVGLRLKMLEHDMGRQDPDAKEESPGRYRAPGILLGMDGQWEIEVVVLTKEGKEIRTPFAVKVPKQPAP